MKAKTTMKVTLPLLPAAFLALASCSSTPTPPSPEVSSAAAFTKGVPGGVIVQTVKATMTVTAVDHAKRMATLLGADGKKFTVKVGQEAVNFDRVHEGDQVTASITEKLVAYVDQDGTASGEGSAAVVALAAKGAQPGGLAAETTQVTARVVAIDTNKHTATLQFDDGTTEILPVRSDVDLSQRNVGEQVVFRVTEMVAISVDKPQ